MFRDTFSIATQIMSIASKQSFINEHFACLLDLSCDLDKLTRIYSKSHLSKIISCNCLLYYNK